MKRYQYDGKLGYIGDKNGKGAFEPRFSITTGKHLVSGHSRHNIGDGYYYGLNPHDAIPTPAQVKALLPTKASAKSEAK